MSGWSPARMTATRLVQHGGKIVVLSRARGAIGPSLRRLIDAEQLLAFKHEGFWRPMDTLKDKEVLEDMVEQGRMPWRLSERVPAVSATVAMKVG